MFHHSEFNQEVTYCNLYLFSSIYTTTHPTSRCCKYGGLGSLSEVYLITEVLFTTSQTSILIGISAASKNFYLNEHGQSRNLYSSKNRHSPEGKVHKQLHVSRQEAGGSYKQHIPAPFN